MSEHPLAWDFQRGRRLERLGRRDAERNYPADPLDLWTAEERRRGMKALGGGLIRYAFTQEYCEAALSCLDGPVKVIVRS